MLGVVSSIFHRLYRLGLDLLFVDVSLDEHLSRAEDGMDAVNHNE